VRDAVLYTKSINANVRSTGVDEVVIADKGVTDKRLLVFEGEFASVLRAQGREGNTLSMVIRNLWDTGDARSMVKTAPTRTSQSSDTSQRTSCEAALTRWSQSTVTLTVS
jgi:hypothetical protein